MACSRCAAGLLLCCPARDALALAEGISQGYSRGTQVKDELSFKEVASIFVSMASFLKATIPYRLRTAECPESLAYPLEYPDYP